MKYSVFSTETDNYVGYVNHRGEFVAVSVCWDHETAQRQADTLNAGLTQQDQRKQQTGNRYMHRYMGR